MIEGTIVMKLLKNCKRKDVNPLAGRELRLLKSRMRFLEKGVIK